VARAKRLRGVTTDPSAGFDTWYVHAYPRVHTAVRLAVGEADLADEATAEAFARALLHWSKVRDAVSPQAWVYTVAMNQTRSVLRRRSIERRWLRRQAAEPVADQQPPTEPDDALWQAVGQLPLRARTAVALRYVGDLSEAEVAEVMGIARGTVAATLNHARKRLAELLDDQPEEERTP
jgi:RNA polymerase sigma-70 factor (ECF subfamily)